MSLQPRRLTCPLVGYDHPDMSRFGRIRQTLSEWEVVIGGGAIVKPDYEGSDEFSVSPVPWVSATYNGWLKVDPTGLTVEVYEKGPFSLSTKIGYEGGREEDDSDALRGLGDVDGGAAFEGRAAFEYGPAEIYASVEKTAGGSDGLLGVAGIELTHAFAPALILGVGASATFADENHMEAYFGVDAAQAVRSGYAPYQAEAGLKRVDLTASLTVGLNEHWFVRGKGGVGLLVGDAADSPIVKEEVQTSGMLLLGYRF